MHRSGYVTICGQPNVGKSTILNAFLNDKLAIVSQKAETTRDNLRGIYTEDDLQIVFVDTPGIHKPHDLLGKTMISRAQSSLMEADIIIMVTELAKAFNDNDVNILERLPKPDEGKTVILVINKVDKVKDKKKLLPLMAEAGEKYPFKEVVPICALKQGDVDNLKEITKTYLAEGPQYYPPDHLTDCTLEFQLREIIREKILVLTYEEVPHSIAVKIELIDEQEKFTSIHAVIYVERTSQKSIIIGNKGSMIKKIGQLARKEIEELMACHVFLDLWVKVYEKWKKDPIALKEMGYTD